MKHIILWLFFITSVAFSTCAQVTTSGLRMMSENRADRTLLRWSPTDGISWQFANTYGYRLERITVAKKGKFVDPQTADRKTWTLKVAPQNAFVQSFKINKDSMAAVALQAVYGQKFETQTQSPNIFQAYERAKELEQRFVFSMYAAARSLHTAKLMGAYFIDSQRVKGESYVYKVWIQLPSGKEKLDTGAVFVDPDRITEYPRNRSLKVQFDQRRVKLTWDYKLHQQFFIGYHIERSEDGEHFYPITQRPFLPLTENERSTSISYLDSVPALNKRYFFRIRGVTFFESYGPYSNITSGGGKESLPVSPQIAQITEIQEGKVKVDWKLAETYTLLVKEFQLRVASAPGKKVKIWNVTDPKSRSLTIDAPYPSNYINIVAVGTDSNLYSSPQHLFQLKDVTPPAIPTKLRGSIDTNGVLRLEWAKNKEPDLYGYRVFYANGLHEEFIQRKSLIFKDTFFIDTIPLRNLTSTIHFKVLALDYRYNPSPLTPALTIKKPDIMPPVSPVFYVVKPTTSGIFMGWYTSSSSDVMLHQLYRALSKDGPWEEISRWDTLTCPIGKSFTFLDPVAQEGKGGVSLGTKYWYKVVAKDFSGNESPPSEPICSQVLDLKIGKSIEKFTLEPDRENRAIYLYWKSKEPARIRIYRQKGEEAFYLLDEIENKEMYTDKQISLSQLYHYKIRGVLSDGSLTPFTEVLEVNY